MSEQFGSVHSAGTSSGSPGKMMIPRAEDFRRARASSSENLKRFLAELSELGPDENNFHTTIDFTHDETEYLEGLGYQVSWNSPCLWWEITV